MARPVTCPTCPRCSHAGPHTWQGVRQCKLVDPVGRWRCMGCGRSFTERSGTLLSGLRTRSTKVISALHARSEGVGVRGTGRLVGKYHSAIIGWERRAARLAVTQDKSLPADFESTIESDEVYTRVGRNRPASESEGWTACGIERGSRYCTPHTSGQRNDALFAAHTKKVMHAVGDGSSHLLSDGETRYAKHLWAHQMATTTRSGHRTGRRGRPRGSMKCLRKGLTVRRKVKGSQQNGPKRRSRYETPLVHHPESVPLDDSSVHCNHSEAYNASLRRRCAAFRRRTNMYAKNRDGLERALDVQRFIYNWARPHWAHEGASTPAQMARLASAPLSLHQLVTMVIF
jgi:transposase-like protein